MLLLQRKRFFHFLNKNIKKDCSSHPRRICLHRGIYSAKIIGEEEGEHVLKNDKSLHKMQFSYSVPSSSDVI